MARKPPIVGAGMRPSEATLTTGGFLVPCLNKWWWKHRLSELDSFTVILR